MKEIKLAFPYPSTSRHNLSQDVALSLSMGVVTPVRTVEVLPGDSHRIGTSFSLISNPIVKPLLQSVNMRYCRFWVPRRIYHLALRANNADYDPQKQGVRFGRLGGDIAVPISQNGNKPIFLSNFSASSIFDYLELAPIQTGVFVGSVSQVPIPPEAPVKHKSFAFNAEPYIGYLDICRNYFADSANDMVGFMVNSATDPDLVTLGVGSLSSLDSYIDGIQNSSSNIDVVPYYLPSPYLPANAFNDVSIGRVPTYELFYPSLFGQPRFGLCVPMVRPDRLSRMFSTRPLTSQNARIDSSEITIGNLSFLSKIERYLTRRFFGGSRYTDVMYSIFGQRVPHVDSPVLLDVFDQEIGSELVSSTNATASQNPGVLGGYFSSSGVLRTGRGSSKKRYVFNESGYIMDLVYIMPRLFRSQFLPDFYPVSDDLASSDLGAKMLQGSFIPDLNGIGWQQPAFNSMFLQLSAFTGATLSYMSGFSSEPSWQQYRTLPDVVKGLLNPSNGWALEATSGGDYYRVLGSTRDINSPVFVFTDHFDGRTVSHMKSAFQRLADQSYVDPSMFNSIFGSSQGNFADNIFVVFRYAHQAKRQVTKRFTLSF